MKRLLFLQVTLLLLLALSDDVKGNGESDGQCKCGKELALKSRPHSVSILEFGAVGDGKKLNTIAFQNAVFYLRSFADKGGAQLYVPPGRWLTGSFNLTSHLTLFLERNAVILGTQDSFEWQVIDPLPSYGRGIELPGGRHRSLINGYKLKDVVITGVEAHLLVHQSSTKIEFWDLDAYVFLLVIITELLDLVIATGDNGTIDGQGSIWWEWYHSQSLNYSRPHLVELESSTDVVISNLTFLNAPAWSIHPVYCGNVHIQNITVYAPSNSPGTNGIVPDSSSDICIEDCYVSVGGDAISLKSGWDEYGIAYGKPTSNVYISRVYLQTSFGSALAFGSEMSGGISNVCAAQLHIHDAFTGIKLKTARGRGGFVKDVGVSDVEMENIHVALGITSQCSDHPDDHFNPDAYPDISGITLKNVIGANITIAGDLKGIPEDPFTSICLSNISLSMTSELSTSWVCADVLGFSHSVFPEPCSDLQLPYSNSSSVCFSLISPVGHAEAF